MTETKPTMYKQLTSMLEIFIRAEWEAEYGYSPCNQDEEFDIYDRMDEVLERIPQGKLSITSIVEALTDEGELSFGEKRYITCKLYESWKESGTEGWSVAWLKDLLDSYNVLYKHAVHTLEKTINGDYEIYLITVSAEMCMDILNTDASIESINEFYSIESINALYKQRTKQLTKQ